MMQTDANPELPLGLNNPDRRGEPNISPSNSQKEISPAPNGVSGLDVATVLKISQVVSGEITLEKLAEVLLLIAIEHGGAERALLILPRGGELWSQAEARILDDSTTVRLCEAPISEVEVPESLVRHAERNQEIVILNDASAQNPYSADEYIRVRRPRSVLCLPFLKQSTLVALLYLENNVGPNIFTPARITILKVLASQAAISLDNSRLYHELQEREGRIRRLVDANIIGVLISDLKGEIIESNDAYLKMVGYTREELVSGRMRWRDLTPVEWKAASEQGVAQVESTGACNVFEKEYYRKDGSRVPVLVGAARFEKNSTVAFAIDLTERKRAEEALKSLSRDLQESKARLEEAQRIAHVGYWERELVTGRVSWSDETYRIFGLQPQERPIDLSALRQMVHPEDREFVLRALDEAVAGGARYDVEYRLLRPTGEIRVVHSEGDLKRDGSGRPCQMFGTVQDITDRKRSEEALKRSEFYLAEGQRLAHAGSWSFKPDLTCDYWSRELFEILGFDPGAGVPTIPDYFKRIHPEDRQIVEATIQQMIAAGEGCDLKKRIIRPDGVQRVIRCVGMPVRESGVITRFVGTLIDITEQEELTQELRRREAYLAEAQRLSHTGSFSWNAVTDELTWSDELYRIKGYDRSIKPTFEVVRSRVHPDDRQLWEEAYKKAMQGREVEIKHRVLMPDGTVKYVHLTTYGTQRDGRFVELVGTVRDITEHKLAEEAVRRSEALLAEGQRLSHTGSWGWNALTGKLTWSEEHFRILGLDPQTISPSLDVLWERVHPDDRTGLRRTFESAIQQKKDFEQEFRIVTPDWSIRHLHGVGHAILNKAGELVEFIGSTMDITERKRAEERAQSQREAILLALNAFVEKLDVDRFLGDVILELNKRFRAKSWELWLYDEGINGLLLHSSSHPTEHFNPEFGNKNARSLEELRGLWSVKDVARAPRILDLSSHESFLKRRHGKSLARRGVKTLIIVPVVLGEENLGFLELHFHSQTQFSCDDLDLAQAMVNHATLALQLNRLTRRAEQLAVTEERNRLAREIHDTLAQAFAGIVLHSEVLGAALKVSKRRCAKALSQIQKLARSGLEEARRSVQALRPKALDGRTLPEALRQAAIRLNDDAKVSCQFRQRGKRIHLSDATQNELFRIGQEALTNVMKHSQAKSVCITLVSQTRRVSLSVKDDGIGFATAKAQEQNHGFGMGTMRERAQRIGGRLRVESRPGKGTTIRVEVPANRSKRKAIL